MVSLYILDTAYLVYGSKITENTEVLCQVQTETCARACVCVCVNVSFHYQIMLQALPLRATTVN